MYWDLKSYLAVLFLFVIFFGVILLFILTLLNVIKNKGKIWKTIFTISTSIFLSLVCITSLFIYEEFIVSDVRNSNISIPDDRVISSVDSLCQIQIPIHWKIIKDLNDNATIQVGDPSIKEYLIIFNIAKSDFAGNLSDYNEFTTKKLFNSLKNGSIGELSFIKVNGNNAAQRNIYGVFESLNIEYLLTTIEGDGVYYQLLAWTLPSNNPKSFKYFNEVISSFNEIKPKL